ncbi:MAG: hypothetical protein ACRDNM_09260 [Gaiellaceae bacterium]
MPELRDVLEQIAEQAPPPRERFDEELWARVHAKERLARRRWRLATVAAATATIAAAGAAGVFALRGTPAGTTVDRTVACRLTTALSSADFNLGTAIVGRYGGGVTVIGPGYVMYAGAGNGLLLVPTPGAKPVKTGYYLDGACASSRARIALSPSGLRSLGVFSAAGRAADLGENCSVASNSTITIRVRVVLSRPGVVASAQLAIRGGKRPHPIAFVSWTPTRFRAYVAPGCEKS